MIPVNKSGTLIPVGQNHPHEHQTTEAALEACIERHLTGGVSVMPSPGGPMSDDVRVYQTSKGAGYLRGKSTDFNSEFAIAEGEILAVS